MVFVFETFTMDFLVERTLSNFKLSSPKYIIVSTALITIVSLKVMNQIQCGTHYLFEEETKIKNKYGQNKIINRNLIKDYFVNTSMYNKYDNTIQLFLNT